jgi:hypothetical protein
MKAMAEPGLEQGHRPRQGRTSSAETCTFRGGRFGSALSVMLSWT